MADAIIMVESQVYNLGKGNIVDKNILNDSGANFAKTQFNAAHVLIIDEIIEGLGTIKEAVNDCMQSQRIKKPLHDVPSILSSIGGALLFLSRIDAAKVAIKTGNKISEIMQNKDEEYVAQDALENLVSVISGMEYYVEQIEILDEDSLHNIIKNAYVHALQLEELVVTI